MGIFMATKNNSYEIPIVVGVDSCYRVQDSQRTNIR